MISARKLWSYLDSVKVDKTKLIRDKVIVGQTYSNLRKNQSITIKTLNSICEYLHCQPGDILEWIPDDEVSK